MCGAEGGTGSVFFFLMNLLRILRKTRPMGESSRGILQLASWLVDRRSAVVFSEIAEFGCG